MQRVLVLGLPRSGTSWAGRVIGRARDCQFVHEPDGDHEAFAIRAKRGLGRHVVLEPGTPAPDYERLWAGAFSGGVRVPSTRARVAKRLFETTAFADRSAARRGDEPIPLRLRLALALAVPMGPLPGKHVVVKSVHAALSVEWVVERFAPEVVIVERDARNVIASWMALGLGGDRRENEALAVWARTHLGIEPPPPDAPAIVQRTFVYGVLSAGLRRAAQRHPDWLVVSHDQLCVDPTVEFHRIFARIGLEWSDAATEYLRDADRAGEGFRTKRITSAQPENWRSKLGADDIAQLTAELDRFPDGIVAISGS